MPRLILPHLETLHHQVRSILDLYRHMLDDEFLFAAAVQVPQAAVIFELAGNAPLNFKGDSLSLAEVLTLVAYRYGFDAVQRVGQGGYAVVLGRPAGTEHNSQRVLRLVPEHHVRNVLGNPGSAKAYNVRLDDNNEPVRDPEYPLLLSDLFLLPRHTTRLVFTHPDGTVAQAAGHPAVLHCQLLPEVKPLNGTGLDRQMAQQAGDLLEAALATLGVSVADAHGGNGGVLIDRNGEPMMQPQHGNAEIPHYIPLVLDYGYYSNIGPQRLAEVLLRNGVNFPAQSRAALVSEIAESDQPLSDFGRKLYDTSVVNPQMWITPAKQHWRTVKEQVYPALHAQSRLSRLYPDYDEVVFPQRIETYTFQI
ncbi:MAG: hypothetical protein AAF787_13160 [Chloroflexota bacterium]